jgi:hypothetical protein
MSRQTAVKMSSLLAESFSCNVCFSLEIRSQSHGQESGGYHNTIHPQRCSLCFPTLPHFGAKKVSTTYGVTRVCCFVAPDKCITIWHSCVPCLKMATFMCAMPEDGHTCVPCLKMTTFVCAMPEDGHIRVRHAWRWPHSCVPCLKMATFVCAMPEDGNIRVCHAWRWPHSCVPCLKMATFVCAMPEDDGNGHNMFYSQVSACIRLCCQSKYTFTCG